MESLLDLSTEETALHRALPFVVEGLDWIAALIDLCAIALLVIGALRFVLAIVPTELVRDGLVRRARMNAARFQLGAYILAGLELFIVSDVIHAALSLAFSDLLFLLMLVIIRSITSYFLDRELDQLKREMDG